MSFVICSPPTGFVNQPSNLYPLLVAPGSIPAGLPSLFSRMLVVSAIPLFVTASSSTDCSLDLSTTVEGSPLISPAETEIVFDSSPSSVDSSSLSSMIVTVLSTLFLLSRISATTLPTSADWSELLLISATIL